MTDTSASSDPRDAPPDWDALARYLAGESPADEARAVAEWLAAHPRDAHLLATLDAVVGPAARSPAADTGAGIDVEAALRQVKARRDAGRDDRATADVLPLDPTARRARWRAGGLVAAAAAALAVGIVKSRSGDVRVPVAAARVHATPVGARDSLRLPDGTRVVLSPGSRLAVAADYGVARREATLEGEAWFAVQHDDARPFVLRAGPALVRDVGTAFTVRTDGVDGARGVAVAVTEGVVALRAAAAMATGDTGVVLAAGDRGVLRASGQVVAERGGVTDDDVAWMRGRLVYRAAPLDVVRADLRRWYGVELRVADSALAGRRLTATFEREPAARVLEIVALALGADVERVGDTAVLRRAAPRPEGRATP